MELYPSEVQKLKNLIKTWYENDIFELEATFAGTSDATTFLAVAQRLKAKGYTEIPQEDKLNILTPAPHSVRFTLTGMAAIEDYCKTDSLDGKAFEAMVKDRTGPESNFDIEEYGTRVKVRRELPLTPSDPRVQEVLQNWKTQKKAFRIIKRWSFMDEKKGLRFDLSLVRSTPKDPRGDFQWATTFQQFDLTTQPILYEIEVELERPTAVPEEKKEEELHTFLKHLVAGVGDVLRGIQKHTFLIRRSTRMKALDGYKELVNSDRFRGVQPKPMEKQNMTKERKAGVPNIRNGYNVTDKADGLRMMGYVDIRGELFLIDMSLNVYRTGLLRLGCANSLVDGEFISQDKNGKSVLQYLIFDIYIAPEKTDVSKLPFYIKDSEDTRHSHLESWIERWTDGTGPTIIPGAGVTATNRILVGKKHFEFAIPNDRDIFDCCARMLSFAHTQPYNTDGLILTPNESPLPEKHGGRFIEQLKWKPAKDNTIDFLVLYDTEETGQEKVYTGVKPGTGETISYKTMRLYVGSENDPALMDPRGTILFEQPLPGVRGKGKGRREYRPVLFTPLTYPDTMANQCSAAVEVNLETEETIVRAESGDPVANNSIVEMRYEPSNQPGWRWIPMRVRHDKTERYQQGIVGRTFNNKEGAEIVWDSIHDPVTQHMIMTGSEMPSSEEREQMSTKIGEIDPGKVYYDRKDMKEDTSIINGLRHFHRLYIKDNILLRSGLRGGGKKLADLACGQGGDLNSWMDYNVGFVYGTDIAEDGITNPKTGAYSRYLDMLMKKGGGNLDAVPKMIFTIGSSALNLSSGEAAGALTEEANIMRAVYGRMNTDGPIPPFVSKYGMNQLRDGADCVAIMFAIHYFFESEQSLNNIMLNISESLALNGLFVGCCFDGESVFKQLQFVPENGSVVGQDKGAEIWKITKRYSNVDITSTRESLGMAIDVKFMSIGTEQREYLVPFELLKKEMEAIGCELLTPEECKELGLVNSTNMFEESYKMAMKQNKRYPMSEDVAKYSFLNRWFIFKRRRLGPAVEEEKEKAPVNVSNSNAVAAAIQQTNLVLEGPKTPNKTTKAEAAQKANQDALKKVAESEKEEAAVAAAAPAVGAVKEKTKYELSELLLFYLGASKVETEKKLKMGIANAGSYLAPSMHFPIKDKDGVEYPSVEHFYYAMKIKYASNKPDLAAHLLSREGTVHQEFLRKRIPFNKTMTEEKELEFVVEERKQVLDLFTPKQLKKFGIQFDESKWITIKDEVLRDGLTQRYELDAKYHDIVEKVKAKKLYMLYYTGTGSGSELGGKRSGDKTIDGENKVGKMIMEIAGIRF